MSQNSLTLPTTGTVSGLQMTQDTNAALDTLNTLASGATAPTSPETGQLWHDTTTNTLRIFSDDSTTWIFLFNLNQTSYLAGPFYTNSVVGSCRNLAVKQTGNATASVAAEEVVVESALGGIGFKISSLSATLTASGNGANGLDTGSLGANAFYALYAIYNPNTRTAAVLATLASTSNGSIYSGTNMPTGYVMSGLIGFLLTNSSSNFVVTTQLDREVFYQSAQSVLNGVTGVASLTSELLTGSVPPSAKSCSGLLSYAGTGADALAVAADSTGTGLQQGTITGSTIAALSGVLNFRHLPITAAQTMYWKTGGTSASSSTITISSFTF
jgi:hypothetical protein